MKREELVKRLSLQLDSTRKETKLYFDACFLVATLGLIFFNAYYLLDK